MSLAITHFAVGGSLTTLVLLYLLPPTRYARSLVLVGGLWGMAPDAHWVFPVFSEQLQALHDSAFAEVFWLHRTLDLVDAGDSKLFGAVAVAGFVATAVLADRWSYVTREQATDPSASPLQMLRSVTVLSRLAGVGAVGAGLALFALLALSASARLRFGLYVGLGAALVVGGVVAALADVDVSPDPDDRRVPRTPPLAVRAALAVGAVTVGVGLLLSPIRSGVNATSVAHAALGWFVGLQTLVFAGAWSGVDGDGDRGGGNGDGDGARGDDGQQ